MTRSRKSFDYDLISDITALGHRIRGAAEDAGMDRYLLDRGRISVVPDLGSDFDSADIVLGFKPNFGLEYDLKTIVTDPGRNWPIDTPERRGQVADLFVRHMSYVAERAEVVAESRLAIKLAAEEVFREARSQGIELELVRIQPAPVLVYGEPGGRGDSKQIFYVHVVMPHDDQGTLTKDSWSIDAEDASDFAEYLRDRTLPELIDLQARFGIRAEI